MSSRGFSYYRKQREIACFLQGKEPETTKEDTIQKLLDKHQAWLAINKEGTSKNRIDSRPLLWGYDLRGANLTRVDFQDMSIARSNLEDANLSFSSMAGEHLLNVNLKNANLEGALLKKTSLPGACLQSANLKNADLREANLKGADLSWADLSGADLRGADLTNAILVNVKLDGCQLQKAKLTNTNTKYTNIKVACFGRDTAYLLPCGLLRIGCYEKYPNEWLTEAGRLGKEQRYSDKEIENYKVLIRAMLALT